MFVGISYYSGRIYSKIGERTVDKDKKYKYIK
jgi:hypothetical protein